jgi:hypothetical protein
VARPAVIKGQRIDILCRWVAAALRILRGARRHSRLGGAKSSSFAGSG